MYKLETHCHSNLISRCSRLSAEQLVDIYAKNGYNGIIVTEHFINTESCLLYPQRTLSYEDKIRAFYEGYLQIKKVANGLIDVFFGFEYGYDGTDILIYGFDEEQLLSMSEIMQMKASEFIEFAKRNGALTVHAHPFREDWYIDHIRLYPKVEGVETYNACRSDFCNNFASIYAKEYQKLTLAGSDIHHPSQPILSGMEFDEQVTSIQDFIAKVRSGKGREIRQKNILIKD